jgi:DNA-binding response OmpR family regulator
LWPGRRDESALHATEQFGFDLILLDLMLPGISGF